MHASRSSSYPELSIVVPTFNGVDRIGPAYRSLRSVVAEMDRTTELIFVDDGSTDNSWSMIKHLAESDSLVRGIRLERNVGQTNALCAGFRVAKGVIVAFSDDDLEVEPRALIDLVHAVDGGADFASGRRHGTRSAIRSRGSHLFNARLRHAGIPIHDAGCGSNAMKGALAGQIAHMPQAVHGHRFKPVIMGLAGSFQEVDVQTVAVDQSTYGPLDLVTWWCDIEVFLGTLAPKHLVAGAIVLPALSMFAAMRGTSTRSSRVRVLAFFSAAVVTSASCRFLYRWCRFQRQKVQAWSIAEMTGPTYEPSDH